MKVFSRSIDSSVVHGYGSIIMLSILLILRMENIVLLVLIYMIIVIFICLTMKPEVLREVLLSKALLLNLKIVAQLGLWNQHFNVEGIIISYNHRSLLVGKLPGLISLLKD